MSVEIMAMSQLKQIMKGSNANSSTAENLLLVETNPSSPTSKDFIGLGNIGQYSTPLYNFSILQYY